MSETIPVVNVDEAKEQAYDDAYNRFKDISGEESEEFHLDGFRDSATYANHVLPKLRALSGHGDRGHGTYTEDREVAVIGEHQVDDIPMDAERSEARYILQEVREAWDSGAYDAAEGMDRYARLDF